MPDYILPIPVQDSAGEVHALDVLVFRNTDEPCADPVFAYLLNGAPVAACGEGCFEVMQSGELLQSLADIGAGS